MSRSLRRRRHRVLSSACAFVDRLEPRRLLAAALGADGTLTITGTTGNDQIGVTVHADNVTVFFNGAEQLFPTADVDRISIVAGAGNDTVNHDFQFAKNIPSTILGGSGDDELFATPNNDSIDGGTGNDTLLASNGSDTLRGGDGNDVLYAEVDQPDTLDGGAGAFDAAFVGTGQTRVNAEWFFTFGDNFMTVTVNGTAGNDTIVADADGGITVNGYTTDFFDGNVRWLVNGHAGNDRVTLSSASTQPATLRGGAGHDSLVGGGGNDLLEGGTGGDTMRGGAGNDTVDYSARTAPVTVGLGTMSDDGEAGEGDNVATDVETIIGGSGNDNLKGHDNANRIEGRGGNDTLIGLGGNDTLVGGPGTDRLEGGFGTDTGVDTTGDTLLSVENATGTGGSATITADRTLLVTGTAGNDSLTIDRGGEGVRVFINGTPTDFATGTFDRIFVRGLDGNDTIAFFEPGTTVPLTADAGSGTDHVIIQDAAVSVIGGTGNDGISLREQGSLTGFSDAGGIDTIDIGGWFPLEHVLDLNAFPALDNVNGAAGLVIGNNLPNRIQAVERFDTATLRGMGGNDTLIAAPTVHTLLEGGAGNDSLLGNSGDDTLEGGAGGDTMRGGAGNDTVDYSSRTGAVTVGLGTLSDDGEAGEADNVAVDVETIIGGSGNDNLKGHNNANRIEGRGGNDTLIGLGGNDTLVGGPGADRLEGGDGTDTGVDVTGDTLVSIENTTGGDPFFVGPDGDVTVTGTDGPDTISVGVRGTDDAVVVTFNGQTRFFGEGVTVTAFGRGGNDSFHGNTGTFVVFHGEGGNDTFVIEENTSDTLFGGDGNDVFDFREAAKLHADVDGGAGTDTVDVSGQFSGSESGEDVIDLNIGTSLENARLGSRGKTVIGTAANNRIDATGSEAAHTLRGMGGNDTLIGGDNADSLDGGEGNDSLLGNAGNDTLAGGPGTDTLNGGEGTDTGVGTTGDTLISVENTDGGGGGTAVITPDRTLLVTGTGVADNIRVNANFSAPDDSNNVIINGQVFTFRLADFDRLQINALGGGDVVVLDVPEFGRSGGTFQGVTINLGDGNDVVRMTEAGATIHGGSGNDSVFGTDAGGPFHGDAGVDFYQLVNFGFNRTLDLSATPTTENARLVADSGTLTGNALNNVLEGGPNMLIQGLGGNDRISGGADFDDTVTLDGGAGNDTLIASGTGDATLRGGSGNDSLQGAAGDDLLDGGTGGDTLKGGAGRDTADYSARTANLVIGLGTLSDDGEAGEGDNVATDIETILGGSGNDTISAANAGATANLLVGNGGNDSLFGGGGNDTLSGNAGADTLNGGEGTDTAINATGDTLISIENSGGGGGENTAVVQPDGTLVVTGSFNADTITAGFLDGDNAYDVFIGTTEFDFELSQFDRVVVNLLGGDDTARFDWGLLGLSANVNTLVNGGDGADEIELTTARASVVGGAGADSVTLIKGGQVTGFDGGTGTDQIEDTNDNGATLDLRLYPTVERGGVVRGTVIGNALDNLLFLTASHGTLLGGGGNDSLVGGFGNDLLDGQDGNDSLNGSLGGDTMRGGAGLDTVDYSDRIAPVTVGLGTLSDDGQAGEGDNVAVDVETIIGGSGNDNLKGHNNANRIEGRGGNDTLIGLGGNDTLVGGPGTDRLEGGDGTDTGVDTTGDTLVSIEIGGGGPEQPTAGIVGGVLTVRGTSDGDSLRLIGTGGGVNVYLGDPDGPFLSFDRDDFTGILLEALGGNDNVLLDDTIDIGRTATLNGGDGNDDFEVIYASAAVSVVGGIGDDDLVLDNGGGADDSVVNPTFDGGSGVDSYTDTNGAVSVTLHPTTENAWLLYGSIVGNDLANTLTVQSEGDIDGGGGNDTISGGDDSFFSTELRGGTGNDTIFANGSNRLVDAGAGNDTVHVRALPTFEDSITGGDGVDTLNFSTLTQPLDIRLGFSGEEGQQQTFYGADFETVIGGSGSDRIVGTDAANRLAGNAGSDTLVGLGANDTLEGGEGNDRLEGGAGTDTLNGGPGTDTGVDVTGDTLISIENTTGGGGGTAVITPDRTLLVTGTGGNDSISVGPASDAVHVSINGAGTQFDVTLFDRVLVQGLGGADVIRISEPGAFASEFDATLTADGGDGNDRFEIVDAPVSVVGGLGDDLITAHASGRLAGFSDAGGIDTFRSDTIEGLFTFDMRLFPALDNVVDATSSLSVIIGNDLPNLIDADEALRGSPVTIQGMGGNDTLLGALGNDSLDGGAGNDTIRGGSGNDSIHGGGGADFIEGNSGNDTIRGNDGNDRLFGGDGNDQLFGDAGDDLLFGQNHADTLDGGAGTNDRGFDDNQDTLTNIEVVLT